MHTSVLADGAGPGQYGRMYETIVVGTDGSDTAAVAWRHAIGLATLSGATLHIVNAYQPVNTVGMALATHVCPATSPPAMRLGGARVAAWERAPP